ncbi:N-acetyltransferase domain-containing protein [Plasmodiophora brassicae]|nr:hypothetical protein PBRA_001170 [Plasmodiophora brassicae]
MTNEYFRYMPFGPFESQPQYMGKLECIHKSPTWMPFVMRENASGMLIGMVAFLNIVPEYKAAEIGMIWVAEKFQGRGYAAEASGLLLWHAFRNLHLRRVEWKAHHKNVPSQNLATKLGVVHEGTFRKHMFFKGESRDSLFYSVIDDDYEHVEKNLDNIVSRRRA